MDASYQTIIWLEPGKRSVRSATLAVGMTIREILADFLPLTAQGIQASPSYTADRER